MKKFWALLQKDLKTARLPVGLFLGISLGLMVFVRFKIATGSLREDNIGIAIVLPLMVLPFWLIWQSMQGLRSEWREDTIYNLLALPASGWQVLGSKLASLVLEYSTVVFINVVSFTLLFLPFYQHIWAVLPGPLWTLRNGFLVYLLSLYILVSFAIVVNFSFLVSKLMGRFQAIFYVWTFVLSIWLRNLAGELLLPYFSKLPPVPLHSLLRLEEFGRDIIFEWQVGNFIGVCLASLGLFWLSVYLFEQHLEITD